MLFEIFAIISTVVVIVLACIEFKRLQLSRKYAHVPGIPEIPLLGNKYIARLNTVQDIIIIFDEIQMAPVSKMFILHVPIFFISDPDTLREIFCNGNTFSDHPYIMTKLLRVKKGLITSAYEDWKPVRKAANPAFSHRMALTFIPIFQRHFQWLCGELETHVARGDTFNLNKYSIQTTIRIILETNFGEKEVNQHPDITHELFEGYLDNMGRRIFTPLLHVDFVYNWTKQWHEDTAFLRKFYEIFSRIARKRQLTQSEANDGLEEASGGRRLFIDEMLKHCKGQGIENNAVLNDNMLTVFMAGYDTSALTISMACLMLAMHPDIDAKVERELFDNYHPGDVIDNDLLRRLTYLDMVLKETLRLYPSAPLAVRTNMKDVHLEKIGHLQKGSILGLNFHNLHRWKHIWGEDADKFNPENFSPENVAQRHPYAYQPFSGGTRNCLGYQYALTSVKVGLAVILSQYRFTTELKQEDLVFKFSMSMKLDTGHMVKVHRRVKKQSL